MTTAPNTLHLEMLKDYVLKHSNQFKLLIMHIEVMKKIGFSKSLDSPFTAILLCNCSKRVLIFTYVWGS
ncbi:hypothetical protein P8452_65039 [Trifolium repens]|nr:hypothetical protein QL285_086435 [Trifolium repens]WJX82257.1 hypothetical protein P8452_65039 [Trifolium repens]